MNTESLKATSKSVDQLEKDLNTSFQHGMTHDEIAKRRYEYGRNIVASNYVGWLSLLMRQFSSLFIITLIVSACLLFFS